MVDSHKVMGVLTQKILYVLMKSIQVELHISQNLAKSMPSFTSQSCGVWYVQIPLFHIYILIYSYITSVCFHAIEVTVYFNAFANMWEFLNRARLVS